MGPLKIAKFITEADLNSPGVELQGVFRFGLRQVEFVTLFVIVDEQDNILSKKYKTKKAAKKALNHFKKLKQVGVVV